MKKIEEFDKNGQVFVIFTKTLFSQNHARTDFFFKNEARRLIFGLVVPLHSFDFIWNMSKILDKIDEMSEILDTICHGSTDF